MVGFRIFDVGLLIVWLVWFFRLRDDDDTQGDDGPGGGGHDPRPGKGPGGGGLGKPLGRLRQAGPYAVPYVVQALASPALTADQRAVLVRNSGRFERSVVPAFVSDESVASSSSNTYGMP